MKRPHREEVKCNEKGPTQSRVPEAIINTIKLGT